MRGVAALLAVGVVLFVGVGAALADDTIVGGEIKFFLYDKSSGEVDLITTEDRGVDYDEENNSSAGFSSAIIYLSKDLSDDLSVELQPEILVHAGATPRLGDTEFYRDEAETELEILRAHITWRLPQGFELKAGYLKPLFTWDYGYELFWHEEYHASYVTANPWLGSWHDSGVEIYRNFETDEFSVPAYLYILNGPDGSMSDNNNGKSILVHVQPEFMSGQVKLLGSYGMGKWDEADESGFTRYAAGANVSFGGFTVRGEYMGGKWEDKFIVADFSTKDVEPFGYYVKAFYQVTPAARVFGGMSHLEHDFSGFFFTAYCLKETYDSYVGGVDYVLADGATAMLTYTKVDAEREAEAGVRNDYSAMLDYSRITLGLRVTF